MVSSSVWLGKDQIDVHNVKTMTLKAFRVQSKRPQKIRLVFCKLARIALEVKVLRKRNFLLHNFLRT